MAELKQPDEKPSFEKKKILEGEKIRLEKCKKAHMEVLYTLINSPKVHSRLTNQIKSKEEFKTYFRFLHNQWEMNRDYSYTILFNRENLILGQISLYNLHFIHDRGEVGLWIGYPYWRHGYGLEALKLILEYGFSDLHLNRIQAHIFTDNIASIKLFEKAGFQKEGVRRQYVFKNTQYLDVFSYALLKEDFEF